MSPILETLEDEEYAYITTQGRRTGSPHRIEIWFVVINSAVWVSSGGRDRSDWVRNLISDPRLTLEIGGASWSARARVHHQLREHPARERLAARYQGWKVGQQLSTWATDSLLIEIAVADD